MAVVTKGTVTQNNLIGSQLLYTDGGTGYGTLVSRILTIFDCNGNLLQTINMGASLTAIYNITADAFFQFICTVIDNTGTYITEVDYVAIGFYTASYLNSFNGQAPLPINNCNLDTAENFLNAALRFNVGDNFVAAQANIVLANYFVNLEQ